MIKTDLNGLQEFLKNKGSSEVASGVSRSVGVTDGLREGTSKIRDWVALAQEVKELINSPVVQGIVKGFNKNTESETNGRIIYGESGENIENRRVSSDSRNKVSEVENKESDTGAKSSIKEQAEIQGEKVLRALFERLSYVLVGQIGFTLEAIIKENPELKVSELVKELEDKTEDVRGQILATMEKSLEFYNKENVKEKENNTESEKDGKRVKKSRKSRKSRKK